MYVATRDFTGRIGGAHFQIHQGERFADEHELVRRFPGKFRKVDDKLPDVEDATAEPGRKRGQ